MCGIAGVMFDERRDPAYGKRVVQAMCEAQRTRGPDGLYTWSNGRVALGMVRLAIVGTQLLGQQPIEGESGARLIFNGELYRPGEVAEHLGMPFSDEQCDGAALLRLLETQGVQGLCGVSTMFALAMFEPDSGSVLLARDAWGQKPLYFRRVREGWAFASTVSAIRVGTVPMRIREEALLEALIFKSVGGGGSAFEAVDQVPPGSWIRIGPTCDFDFGRWRKPERIDGTLPDAATLRSYLTRAIKARCPAGFRSTIFLSGGLDSSIVATVARQHTEVPSPRVLTVGYEVGGSQDEHALAIRLADELGLDRETVILKSQDVPELFEAAAAAMEDPNHDPVVIPTLALTRYASAQTKVVLTGDGSDEFWGGYSRFDAPPATLDEYLRRTMVFSPEELGLETFPDTYLDNVDVPPVGSMAPLDRYMRVEALNRMRNYHLSRIDKLSMAVGLEARSPFLDSMVTRYAESLPAAGKRLHGRPKGLLIDAFANVLPEWLLRRRKQPFSVPIRAWLAGPIREWCHDQLGSPNAFVRKFTDPRRWLDALSGDHADDKAVMHVWSLLYLEVWYRVFGRLMEVQA